MPTVTVEEIAAGVQMTKGQLESVLVDLQRVVVQDESGRSCHLEGGEAAIWRAGRNGEYAIKAFRKATYDRAAPEFEKLQTLRASGYVPRVYGLGRLREDDGVESPAIIEEYVRGTSLADLITHGKLTGDAQDGHLDAVSTARIALELAKGIRALNEARVVHRDVSPNNVLLDDTCVENGLENVSLRLVDFGVSTSVDEASATALGAGPRLATIPYGAPEMFGGDYSRSSRPLPDGLVMPGRDSSYTDVWSIGAIIVFLMWGEYWPKDIEDICLRQRGGQFRAVPSDLERIAEAKRAPIDLVDLIQQRRGQVTQEDKELAKTVRRCTEYDPTLRFSVDQLETNLFAMLTRWEEEDTKTRVSCFTPVFDSSQVQNEQGDSAYGAKEKNQDAESSESKMGDFSNRSMMTKGEDQSNAGSNEHASQNSTRHNDKGFDHQHERKIDDTSHKESQGKERSRTVPLVGRLATAVALVAAVSFVIAAFVLLPSQNSQKAESTPSETVEKDYAYDSPNEEAKSDAEDAKPGDTSGESQPDYTVPNVSVRPGINDYSWDELKTLADAIAQAEDDDEGLAIAKAYNLTDEDGRLQGDTKGLMLNDGTETSVRILGFRHDELADGGLAGISFEFADVPTMHSMNVSESNEVDWGPVYYASERLRELIANSSNEGGWKASGMRAWLNDDFLASLPGDLQNLIEPVKKMTNNVGEVEDEYVSSVVTPTLDRLWFLSLPEVYGMLSVQENIKSREGTIYDAEGTQYQLYADQGVTVTSYDYSNKNGADSVWWLRSPLVNDSYSFRAVWNGGQSFFYTCEDEGVSPCFCF